MSEGLTAQARRAEALPDYSISQIYTLIQEQLTTVIISIERFVDIQDFELTGDETFGSLVELRHKLTDTKYADELEKIEITRILVGLDLVLRLHFLIADVKELPLLMNTIKKSGGDRLKLFESYNAAIVALQSELRQLESAVNSDHSLADALKRLRNYLGGPYYQKAYTGLYGNPE